MCFRGGIEADAQCSGGSGTSYYAWYEWYPNTETSIGNFSVSPGDSLSLEIWYTTTAPYGHIDIGDYNTEQSVTLAFNPPSGTSFNGNSAEWIVEAPTVNGQTSRVAQYLPTPFRSTAVGNSSGSHTLSYYVINNPTGITPYNVGLVYSGIANTVWSSANLYNEIEEEANSDTTLWFFY